MRILTLLILANTPWSDRVVPYLVLISLLVIAGLLAYASYRNASPFRIESSSNLSPGEVLDSLQVAFARDGWIQGFRDARTLVMSIDRNAPLGSAAALGCLSVWFALLYLISSRKRITVEIGVSGTVDGSLIVVNGNRSGSYLTYVAWHLRELPKS